MHRYTESRLFCALLAILTLGGCSPLGLYNAVIPYDGGSRLSATDIAYGPGPRHRLDVYTPVDDATVPRPVIVFFYGGSWKNGRKSRYTFAGRALAALGAVVVVADYRLVPDVRYPDFLKDNADAVAWAHRHAAEYGGDPERIVLAGHSAGAFNAMSLALNHRYLDVAGVPRHAVDGVIGLSGPYDFDPREYRATRAAFDGSFDAPDLLPLAHIDGGDPPVLLVHGENDTTVYPKNSRALATALEQAGVPVALRVYPGLDHAGALLAISKPLRDRAPVLAEIRAFLRTGLPQLNAEKP